MPCNDVTEILRIRLDGADRLAGYQLAKRTCGKAIGEESLLAEEFVGRPATDLIAIDGDEYANALPESFDEAEIVIHLKHLFAVQAGLRALLGLEAAGAMDPVRVAAVSYEGDEVMLDAELVVDVLTEKIKSCGRCKGCASLKKVTRVPVEV